MRFMIAYVCGMIMTAALWFTYSKGEPSSSDIFTTLGVTGTFTLLAGAFGWWVLNERAAEIEDTEAARTIRQLHGTIEGMISAAGNVDAHFDQTLTVLRLPTSHENTTASPIGKISGPV